MSGERDGTHPYVCPGDWVPVRIERGWYCNDRELIGFRSRVNPGRVLHPADRADTFEADLAATYARWRRRYPAFAALRRHVKMPYWHPCELDLPRHYAFTGAPEELATTSISILTVPNEAGRASNGHTSPIGS